MPGVSAISGAIARFDRTSLLMEAMEAAPEAFDVQGQLLSAIAGTWEPPCKWMPTTSPIDGQAWLALPVREAARAAEAVERAAAEGAAWGARPLGDRAAAVTSAAALLRAHRDVLVGLVAWDIGKTASAAGNDVDRCIAGIEWYLKEIGWMMEGRRPLGLVSNVASWNYPFSVLLLNMLVQVLAGNPVVAKIPTQGGAVSLTVATALLRRAGLPVTLIGGRGRDLTEPLVGHPAVRGLAFVGGRNGGDAVARRLESTDKRYALEMEGVNAYVVTRFSNWEGLGRQIRSGFEFGKQRCTAYARWVVQRELVPRFVDTYIQAVQDVRVGHPLFGRTVDFGPLISAAKVDELRGRIAAAQHAGAEVLYQGELAADTFEPGQDRSAYLAPTLLRDVPRTSELYAREPFGPVDVLVPVDSEEEMIAEANISEGALVSSVATDDAITGERVGSRLRAFKVGINRLRSRGDREEPFGGVGRSWEGAFVGGENLVRAFTEGPQPLHGNWGT